MSSSKLILFFIGIILLIIIILSSNKLGIFFRQKFGKYLPSTLSPASKVSPTPIRMFISPTATPVIYNSAINNNSKKSQVYYSGKSTSSDQIPATGPENILYLLLSGSMITGFTLNKIASRSKKI
jgi:hypothetical protein